MKYLNWLPCYLTGTYTNWDSYHQVINAREHLFSYTFISNLYCILIALFDGIYVHVYLITVCFFDYNFCTCSLAFYLLLSTICSCSLAFYLLRLFYYGGNLFEFRIHFFKQQKCNIYKYTLIPLDLHLMPVHLLFLRLPSKVFHFTVRLNQFLKTITFLDIFSVLYLSVLN